VAVVIFLLFSFMSVCIILVFIPEQKLWFPGHQISLVSDWVRNFCPWPSLAMEIANGTKFGTKVA